MQLLIYGPGRLGGARRGRRRGHGLAGAADVGRPAPADAVPRSAPTPSSTRRCRAPSLPTSPTRSPAATARVRPRDDGPSNPRHRQGPRPAPRRGRGGGRRPEPLPRRRAVPAARGDRGGLVRAGRRLRAVDRRVAPARQGRPTVGDRRGAGRRIVAVDPRWAAPDPGEARGRGPPAGHDRRRTRGPRGCRDPGGRAPGTHLVGFDGTGESIELRLTARDRSGVRGRHPRRRRLARSRAAVARAFPVPPLRRRRRRPHRGLDARRPGLKSPMPDLVDSRSPDRPHASPKTQARSPPWSPRSRPTAPSTRPPSAARPLAGPGRHRRGSCRAARPASPPPSRAAERDALIAVAVRSPPNGHRGPAHPAWSPGPGPTTPPRPSGRPGGRPTSAPTPPSSWRPTTTGRTAGCSRRISGRSPTRATCRSSSTTSLANRRQRRCRRPSFGSRSTRASSAVKEASGNLEQIAVICRDRPRDVAVLAGDDVWTLPILALGGDGVVSVASNEIPGRDGGPLRGRAGRRLGDRAARARSLAAAVPRELPRRPEPGPGEGGPGRDGPARSRTRSGRRSSRSVRTGSATAMAAPLRRLGLVDGGGRISGGVGRLGRPGGAWPASTAVPTSHATPGPSPRSGRVRSDGVLDSSRPAGCAPRNPIPTAPDGWRVRTEVKAAILDCFRDRTTTDWHARGPLTFRDRAAAGHATIWPAAHGGSCRAAPPIRRGAHLGDGVVVMPPSYVNIGAWIGAGTMVDSHVLVGSCAQIGARVHLAGGRDDRWRARAARRPAGDRRGRRVRRGGQRLARRRPGRTRRGHRRGRDPHRDARVSTTSSAVGVLQGTADAPLVVPPGAVVIPGSRALAWSVRRAARAGGPRSPCWSRIAMPGRRPGSRSRRRSDEPRDRTRERRVGAAAAAETRSFAAAGSAASIRTSWRSASARRSTSTTSMSSTRQVTALARRPAAAVDLAYAVKANPALAVVAHLGRLGLGADVASGGELAHGSAGGDRGRSGRDHRAGQARRRAARRPSRLASAP